MFNVTRKHAPNQLAQSQRPGVWDPASLVENLLSYDPFAEMILSQDRPANSGVKDINVPRPAMKKAQS